MTTDQIAAAIEDVCDSCQYDRDGLTDDVCDYCYNGDMHKPKEPVMLKPCLAPGETIGPDGVIYESLRKWILLGDFVRVSPDGSRAEYLCNSAWTPTERPDLWPEWAAYRKGYAEGLAARDEA